MNPCLSCGACCSYFRVSFYWREAERADSTIAVPEGFWIESKDHAHLRIMKGTERSCERRCIALRGKVGADAQCGIYENRPTPCRDFEASFSNGTSNDNCDRARVAFGLSPLEESDWNIVQEKSESKDSFYNANS